MSLKRIPDGDAAEDGHPCEAALQFRRAVIRMDVANEISSDALDLAIAFAWIGKAVSRSDVCAEWHVAGIDPNTYVIIPLLSSSGEARAEALRVATVGAPMTGYERDLARLRAGRGFIAAVQVMKDIARSTPSVMDVMRLSELAELSLGFPEHQRSLPKVAGSGNVVMFDQIRKRRQAASN